MKIAKDGEYIIVKDGRKIGTKEDNLTQEELDKWGTPSFLNYLSKRAVVKKAAPVIKPTVQAGAGEAKPVAIKDSVLLKRKIAAANKNMPVQKGIKITVGLGQKEERHDVEMRDAEQPKEDDASQQ